MICPYCAEEVPANSRQHYGCSKGGDKEFPPFYLDYHAGEGAADPIVLSVVGFKGHGKTVYLCALFDYLDNHLTYLWPNFFNHVLDQESLSTLNGHRRELRECVLPQPTAQDFPRPGIFRLTKMPRSAGGNGLPPLTDTTVLIYDPPGEAFDTEGNIVEFASFVRRSSCVLFLVDLTALGESIADEMALLLDTYVLGMRRMEIPQKSQHLIVVYTKSDQMKVSVPEFRDFLAKKPRLEGYLNEQRPMTLADPNAHFEHLEEISRLLEGFTRSELNAARFIHVATDWFESVNYTVVSSLGAAPAKVENGNGNAAPGHASGDAANPLDLGGDNGREQMRLPVKMSPRGVADPLLYVLAKSIKPEPTPQPLPVTVEPDRPRDWLVPVLVGGGALLLVGLLALFALLAWVGPESQGNQDVQKNKTTNARPTPTPVGAPKGMVYVPGGEFYMGSADGDGFERPPHRVAVRPFFIDLYEVTCGDYARFIEQTGHTPPPGWRGSQYPEGASRRPVIGVSWDDAVAYARWANKRLPTEEEWEFAARGTDGRIYPWGGEWRAGMANTGASGGPADVGAFKGVSPFGVYDMVGNVWEWTASDLRPYPGGQLPPVPQGPLKVIRGGSWLEGPEKATATYRGYLLTRGGKDYSATGLRCALDVGAKQF